MSAGGKKRSYGAVNYWITVAAILPFLVMIITGVVVQATYHFGRHPADYQVMGIAGAGWVNAHRLSSVAAIACVAFHLYLHREYIGNVLLKKISKRGSGRIRENFWLLVIFTVTSLTGVVSWLFLSAQANRTLVEIHDKLGMVLIVLSLHHVAHRWGWLKKRTAELLGG